MNWPVGWHCRGCNLYGIQDISSETVLKNRKPGQLVLNVLEKLIEHDCPNKDIGVKLIQVNVKE